MCSITPTNRPVPSVLRNGQSIARSGSRGRNASRCHLAWKRPSFSIGRDKGAWTTSNFALCCILPSLINSTRASFAKGIYQLQYHQPSAPTPSGKEWYWLTPGAVPKKSPSGAHTLGVVSPSQLICRTSSRSMSRSPAAGGWSNLTRMPVKACGPFSRMTAVVLPAGAFTVLFHTSPPLLFSPAPKPQLLRIALAPSSAASSAADSSRLKVGTCVPLGKVP